MRKLTFASLVSLVLVAGCFPFTLHPLYTDEDLICKAELEGTWQTGANETWTFEPSDDTSYRLTIQEGDEPVSILRAHLLRLKEYTFLDLTVEEGCEMGDWAQFHLMRVHTFWHVEVTADELKMRTIDIEWLEDRIENKRLWVAHEKVQDRYVMTAEPKRLQRFALKWIKNADAYTDWETATRPPSATTQ